MSLDKIQTLLRESIGLNPESIGMETIKRDIVSRMTVHGMNDYERYYSFLLTNHDEVKKLIEEVIVPETWFLRDKKPFDGLSAFVKTEWNKKEHLNILSLPCSTGEEPYSIAITLLQNGLSPADFSITAIDISLQNILNAMEGIYTQNSFRGTDAMFRQKYFTTVDDCYRLNDNIKNTVTFKNVNLFELDICEHQSRYHVIFCRNLLIYFDRDTQQVAVSILGNMLREKGILFAGHAESSPYMTSWVPSKRYPNAFAFRKFNDSTCIKPGTAHKPRRVETGNESVHTKQPTAHIKHKNIKPLRLAPAAQKETSGQDTVNVQFNADKALSLANEGHLDEAATVCDEYISLHGPDINAFMVLALVRNATGNKDEAMDYLRKVIYLQPDHYDALIHLASLAKQSGKTEEAEILIKRAERINIRDKMHLSSV